MKKSMLIVPVGIAIAGLLYVTTDSPATGQNVEGAVPQKHKLSYGVGFYLGNEVLEGLKLDGIDANLDMIIQGFVDGIQETEPALPPDEMDAVLFAVHEELQARMVQRLLADDPAFKKLHDDNLAVSMAFHKDYGKEEGVVTQANGLQYLVLRPGTGPSPKPTDTVVLTARVTLIDGTEVDGGERIEVVMDSLRTGGLQILQMMKVGGKWHAAIPPHLAYGPAGDPPRIGPNQTLIAEVELLGIK